MSGQERRAYASNVDQVKQPTLALYLVLGKQTIFSIRFFETVAIKDDTPGSTTVKTSYMNNVN